MPNTRSFRPKTDNPLVSPASLQSGLASSSTSRSGTKSQTEADLIEKSPEDFSEPQVEERPVQSGPTNGYEPPIEAYSNANSYGGGYNTGYRRYGQSSAPAYAREARTTDRDLPTVEVSGYLDLMPEGHGYLRPKYTPSDGDVYISMSQIRRFNLKPGDFVEGGAREPKETERYFGLLQVSKVNGRDSAEFTSDTGAKIKRVKFEDLTAIYPNKHLQLETGKTPLSQRMIDLIAPIGFGQRGLVVSPPKAGKTTILKEIAAGITKNHPEVILMAVLVGERPEEVTDLSRSIVGDVIASNFDEPAEFQTRAAEIAIERAKRLVEEGKDVVILLDSITRLGRAYNLSVPPSGRTLSGGFDPVALYPPKKFFGAARNCEEGGSLTIIGTALVDTGSRLDDLVYEEFKGTGNMELHLDRRLAERRIFPSIDVESSGTRQEQLLYDKTNYEKIATMHRMIRLLNDQEQTERLIEQLSKTASNEEFLGNLATPK